MKGVMFMGILVRYYDLSDPRVYKPVYYDGKSGSPDEKKAMKFESCYAASICMDRLIANGYTGSFKLVQR